MKMGKPLWAKSVITRSFVMALIFFVASSGALFMGASFAKYYTQKRAEDAAIVGSFILEDDVVTSSLTMSCKAANIDTKGTMSESDDEYFVDWRIKVDNVNDQGKISTVKTRYDFILTLPDSAPDYLTVTVNGKAASRTAGKTYYFDTVGVMEPGVQQTNVCNVSFRIPRQEMKLYEKMVNGTYQWSGGEFTLSDITLKLHAEQIQGEVAMDGWQIPVLAPWEARNDVDFWQESYFQWGSGEGVDDTRAFKYDFNSYAGTGVTADLTGNTTLVTDKDSGYFVTYLIPAQVGRTYEIKVAYKANLTNANLQIHDDVNYYTNYSNILIKRGTTLPNTDEWSVLTYTITTTEENVREGMYALRLNVYAMPNQTMSGTVSFEVLSAEATQMMPVAKREFTEDVVIGTGGWKPWFAAGVTTAHYSVDTTQNYGMEGTGSYKIYNEDRQNQNVYTTEEGFIVGRRYRVSVAIKTQGVYTSGRGVGAYADFGPMINGTYHQDFILGYWHDISSDNSVYIELGDNDWQVFTMEFVAESTTYSFRARLWGSYGTMWIDNYSVELLP